MVSATTSAKTSAMVSATVSATVSSAMISAMLSATVSAMVSDCGGLPLSASVGLQNITLKNCKDGWPFWATVAQTTTL